MKSLLVFIASIAAIQSLAVVESGWQSHVEWVNSPKFETFGEPGRMETSAPVVVGDLVYTGRSSGEVASIHRIHGYTVWERKLPGNARVEGAITYGRSKIFVGATNGKLYGLNSADGSIAWEVQGTAEWLSAPSVSRDRVFVVSAADELVSLNEVDGKERWKYSQRGDEKMTVRGTSTPTVFGNEVYCGFSDGSLVALSAASGRVLWKQKLKSRERFYDVDMTPYVDEKSVIAATFDGSLYHLNRLNGEILWVLRVGSHSGFLVEGDKIFFSGLNGHIMAVNREDGSVIWKTPYEGGVGQTPVRVGNLLLVATSGDPLYALDPTHGKIVWQGRLGSGAFSPVVADADGGFLVMSNFGNLYSYSLKAVSLWLDLKEKLMIPTALSRFD